MYFILILIYFYFILFCSVLFYTVSFCFLRQHQHLLRPQPPEDPAFRGPSCAGSGGPQRGLCRPVPLLEVQVLLSRARDHPWLEPVGFPVRSCEKEGGFVPGSGVVPWVLSWGWHSAGMGTALPAWAPSRSLPLLPFHLSSLRHRCSVPVLTSSSSDTDPLQGGNPVGKSKLNVDFRRWGVSRAPRGSRPSAGTLPGGWRWLGSWRVGCWPKAEHSWPSAAEP